MIVTRLVITERVRLPAQVCGDIVYITPVTVPSRLKECSCNKKFADVASCLPPDFVDNLFCFNR